MAMPNPSASLPTKPGAAYSQGASDAKSDLGLSGDSAPEPKVPAPPGPSMPQVANTSAAEKNPGYLPPPKPGVSGIQVPPSPSSQVSARAVPGDNALPTLPQAAQTQAAAQPSQKVSAFSLGITPEQRVSDAKKESVRQPPTNERGPVQVPTGIQAAFQYLQTPSESDPYTLPGYVP